MEGSMLVKEVEVYSDKYDVHGIIRDYNVVTKLFFTYRNREIVIGIHRDLLNDEKYEYLGKKTIESYIDNLADDNSDRKTMLHYWYLNEHEVDGTTYTFGHGTVTGHKKLSDSMDIVTSAVLSLCIDENEEELLLFTKNTVYHCPLDYCRFDKQDKFPDLIPDYERLKEKYCRSREFPSIEPGKVLLVLANFCEYYFHSLCYVPMDSEDGERLGCTGWPHIGTFQDSYLIGSDDGRIDIRYFPHFQNIDFYSCYTDECPLYIENIGDSVIYADTHKGLIRLAPGDRKEVSEENAEKEKPVLPGGDLYPAGIIESSGKE